MSGLLIPGSLELALHEITLVAFTTLVPAGILAFALLALVVGFAPGMGSAQRARLWHWSALPLFAALLGLVVSANHLGTPGNALYVFTGVGRSPLSNEVAAVSLALGAGGTFWLCSYASSCPTWLRRAWAAFDAAFCLLAVAMVAMAYDVPTILSWSGSLPAAEIWATGLAGAGPAVLLVISLARAEAPLVRLRRFVLVGSACCLVVSAGLAIAQGLAVAGMANAVAQGAVLLPLAWGAVAVYTLAGAGSLVLAWRSPRLREPRAGLAIACVLFLLGLFCLRFFFYLSHMTAGISL